MFTDPCIFPVDCPDFGGFVSSTTVIKADYWKLGQVKAGDTIQYRKVSLDNALSQRRLINRYVDQIAWGCTGGGGFEDVATINPLIPLISSNSHSQAIIHAIEGGGSQPRTLYRQVRHV